MYGRATFDNDVKPPHSCNPVNKLSSVVLNPDEKKKKKKKKNERSERVRALEMMSEEK